VIASVVRGRSGSVSVGCVDMQVRRGVIFALGHCVHHLQEALCLLHLQFSTLHLKTLSNRIHPCRADLASKTTMRMEDKKRAQRGIAEPQCVLEFAALYSRNMFNSVQPNHGCQP